MRLAEGKSIKEGDVAALQASRRSFGRRARQLEKTQQRGVTSTIGELLALQ
jgi:hypothetical protein